jgi:hypothetical protein
MMNRISFIFVTISFGLSLRAFAERGIAVSDPQFKINAPEGINSSFCVDLQCNMPVMRDWLTCDKKTLIATNTALKQTVVQTALRMSNIKKIRVNAFPETCASFYRDNLGNQRVRTAGIVWGGVSQNNGCQEDCELDIYTYNTNQSCRTDKTVTCAALDSATLVKVASDYVQKHAGGSQKDNATPSAADPAQ